MKTHLKLFLLSFIFCFINLVASAQIPAAGTVTFTTSNAQQAASSSSIYAVFVPTSSQGQGNGFGFEFITQGTGTGGSDEVLVSYNNNTLRFNRNNSASVTNVYIRSARSGALSGQTTKSAAGGEFKMTSIALLLNSGSATNVTIEAYRNGALVGTQVSSISTTKQTVTLSSDFSNIDEIMIVGFGSSGISVDNIITAAAIVNEAPIITSNGGGATASVNMPESSMLVTTITATDVNTGSTQSYSITGGADAGKFSINSSTGVLSFISAPSFKVLGSAAGNNAYVVNVTVTDNGSPALSDIALSDVQTLTVNVTEITFLTGYGFRIPVILNNATLGLANDLTDFPVLVYIEDDALKITGACSDKVKFPNGPTYDFAFTDGGTGTQLFYDLESYDQINGKLLVWVKIPTFSKSSNNSLYFYFGSNSANTQDPTSTWTIDYQAIYHFSERSTTATVLDATNKNKDAIQSNTTIATDRFHEATGLTGGGYSFNGSNSTIISASTENTQTAFTLSAWVRTDVSNIDQKVVSNQKNYGYGYKLSVKGTTATTMKVETEIRASTPASYATPGLFYNAGLVGGAQWHYIQGVFNGASSFTNYVDGIAQGTGTGSAPGLPAVSNISIGVDNRSAPDLPEHYFKGMMDEIRISNVAKSADWIKAEFANQYNPINFRTQGVYQTDFNNASTLKGGITYSTANGSTFTYTINNITTTAAPPNDGTANLTITGSNAILPQVTSIYGLTVNASSNINLNGQTMNVACNIINNGNISYSDIPASSITFNGTSAAQTYIGNTALNSGQIGNLTINNSANGTITLSGGPVDIYNQLIITQGNLVIDESTTTLTLKSTASLTASVPLMPSTSTITGNIYAERYMAGGSGRRGYRLISAPLASQLNMPSGLNSYDLKELIKTVYISGPGSGNTIGSINTNGFDASPNNNASAFVYKESDANPTSRNILASDYKGFASINEYVPMGNGILFFYRGDRTLNQSGATTPGNSFVPPYPIPNSNTLKFYGKILQGNVDVNIPLFSPTQYYNIKGTAGSPSTVVTITGFTPSLSYTDKSSLPIDGFNLVGNPFPSTIDLEKVTFGAGIGLTTYILNSQTQTFATYVRTGTNTDGTALNGASRYVLSGEGFFVKALPTGTSANRTITFPEAAKTTYPGGAAGSATAVPTVFSFKNNTLVSLKNTAFTSSIKNYPAIKIKLVQDSVLYNETLLTFKAKTNDNFTEEDVSYLTGPDQRIFMYSLTADGISCAINEMGSLENVKSVKLFAEGGNTGKYQLQFEGIHTISSRYHVFLKDAYTKDSVEITTQSNYSFNIDRNLKATYGLDRFSLVIHKSVIGDYKLISFQADPTTIGHQLNWNTENESDVVSFELQRSVDGGQTFVPLSAIQSESKGSYSYLDEKPITGDNIYRLKQIDINEDVYYSDSITLTVKDIWNNSVNDSMIVYPNPASRLINVDVREVVKNPIQFDITNSIGSLVKRSTFQPAQHFEQDISNLAPGIYFINLYDTVLKHSIGSVKFLKD
ncbi:MAG: hypothetical protein JWN56_666 [Sphingobacteriales bacterium]|nr:hypothetical protein [Sphingobacteriales bacterium]